MLMPLKIPVPAVVVEAEEKEMLPRVLLEMTVPVPFPIEMSMPRKVDVVDPVIVMVPVPAALVPPKKFPVTVWPLPAVMLAAVELGFSHRKRKDTAAVKAREDV